jgi:hypothetical protein
MVAEVVIACSLRVAAAGEEARDAVVGGDGGDADGDCSAMALAKRGVSRLPCLQVVWRLPDQANRQRRLSLVS